MQAEPIAREIVLVGGGHSHVIFLRMLGMNPVPGLKVTLISSEYRTPYSGMLPGLVAGHYEEDEVYIDLGPLCRFAGAAFVVDEVTGLDLLQQTVNCQEHPPVRYDVASLDIGITPSVPTGLQHDSVIPVKPISRFLDRWRAFTDKHAEAPVNDVAVVGAGAGGTELVMAIDHYLDSRARPGIHLFSNEKTILREFPASVRHKFEKSLASRDIIVHRDFDVVACDNGALVADDGRRVPIDTTFLVTDAAPQDWPGQAGLAVDDRGFIKVSDTLQSLSHENVFAVGDCAVMVNHPRPKAGVYAVRQGPPLFKNLMRYAVGRQPEPFSPQKRFLSLISTGDRKAVGSRNGVAIEGAWVWRWKNWIDQRFMRRFREFPEMAATEAGPLAHEFDEQMQCGGCGSKVSPQILDEVLDELTGEARPLDDAAVLRTPAGKIALQSVDHFRGFIDDPYLLARVAAVHALSDVYACGGSAHSAQILLTLPFAKPPVTKNLLKQVMAGTLSIFEADGVQLNGGHTSEGQELSIGFAVTGFADEDSFLSKQGLRAGDKLVLTKPLGTGALFAADMESRAKGEWIGNALQVMQQSNRQASELLARYDVAGCTDVTGFGLAGHLGEMIRGSGNGARLNIQALPLLEGATACIDEFGITSTLHEANKMAVLLDVDAPEIVFDPQTSGGLLFGVASAEADECVQVLIESGYGQAAVIGEVTDSGTLEVER